MKGDGIYSRYFNPMIGGPGTYTFEITVSDSGSIAYTWQHNSQRNVDKTPVNSGKSRTVFFRFPISVTRDSVFFFFLLKNN